MLILTREQYHQRRIARAIAEVIQSYYNNFGDEDGWDLWIFEEEKLAKKCVCEKICREDGFIFDASVLD